MHVNTLTKFGVFSRQRLTFYKGLKRCRSHTEYIYTFLQNLCLSEKVDGSQELQIGEMYMAAKCVKANWGFSVGLLVYILKYDQFLLLSPWFCPFWSLSAVHN